MRIKQLLTKTLLVVALLGVGSLSAWADQTKMVIFSTGFETGSATDYWKNGNGSLEEPNYANSEGKCAAIKNNSDKIDWFFTPGTYNQEVFNIEFDFFLINKANTVTIAVMSGDDKPSFGTYGYLYDSGNKAAHNPYFFCMTASSLNGSIKKPADDTEDNNYTFTEATWYHVKLDVDASDEENPISVTYNIYAKSNLKTSLVNGTYNMRDGESKTVNGFCVRNGRYSYNYGNPGIDNVDIYYMAEGVLATTPTNTLTGVIGVNRVYSISFLEGETLHYTKPGDATEYTATESPVEVTITTDGDLTSWTTRNNSTSTARVTPVTTGEEKLASPKFTRGAYSGGNYSISISSDQSSVLLRPSATIKYRIGDTGNFEDYSTAVSVPEGSTLYAYAYNANYASSDVVSTTTSSRTAITSGNWETRTIIDFSKDNRGGDSFSLTDEGTFTVGSNTYKPVILNGTTYEDFGMTSANNILLSSSNNSYDGLYPWNANINAGIKDLKEGQYVLISTNNASKIASPSSNLTLCEEYNTNTERIYRVNADGNASFAYNKDSYVYLFSVTVCQETVTATIGEYGYATFSSTSALDFTDVTDLTAYIATGESAGKIVLQPVTGKVAAGTGLVIKSTNGGAASVSIPVAASGTSYNTETDPINYLFKLDGSYDKLGAASNGGTNYVLSVQNESVVFAPIGTTKASVTAGHAALWLPGTGARSLSFVFGEETTGISDASLMNNEETVKSGEVYNLNGQLVAAPSNGIYIVDGKKVIIK